MKHNDVNHRQPITDNRRDNRHTTRAEMSACKMQLMTCTSELCVATCNTVDFAIMTRVAMHMSMHDQLTEHDLDRPFRSGSAQPQARLPSCQLILSFTPLVTADRKWRSRSWPLNFTDVTASQARWWPATESPAAINGSGALSLRREHAIPRVDELEIADDREDDVDEPIIRGASRRRQGGSVGVRDG